MLATTPLHHFQVQILSTKIEAALLDLLQQAKEAGTKASLSFTTVGGKMEAKFEVSLSLLVLPQLHQVQLRPALLQEEVAADADVDAIVDRQLARSKARAAAHQASLAPFFNCPF